MIKTDQRDVKRFQLYFSSFKDEVMLPPPTGFQVHITKIRDNNIIKGKSDIPVKPEWMKVGQKVNIKPYHKRGKPKIMTIRSIDWPFLVTFEEMPIGGTNPRRILGPFFENDSLDSDSET